MATTRTLMQEQRDLSSRKTKEETLAFIAELHANGATPRRGLLRMALKKAYYQGATNAEGSKALGLTPAPRG